MVKKWQQYEKGSEHSEWLKMINFIYGLIKALATYFVLQNTRIPKNHHYKVETQYVWPLKGNMIMD